MTKFPFTPEILDALPEELAELFRGLEDTLLDEICTRLDLSGQLNEVTVQAIRALRSHGISLDDVKRAVGKTTGSSKKKLDELLDDVVKRNQQYYSEIIDLAGLTQPETMVDTATIEAIKEQAQREFGNITRSMGFLVDNGRTMLKTTMAYQWALDSAALQVQSGAVSYNRAIRNAVKQLADSGLKSVEYESGHVDQIDVAARRAVMTGVSQLCAKYVEQSAEWLGTSHFEISAHAGARDKPGPSPWSSHKAWQGKVYSTKDNDIYPNIHDVCGLGEVDGLEGANCRHRRFPWIEGVSERTYTDEQLAHIDDGLGCDYDGRHYTAYEATQMQRRIERQIRKQKRLVNAYKAAGLEEDATAANVKLLRLQTKYKEFSKAAGLPEQTERMEISYTDQKSEEAAIKLGAKRLEEAERAELQNQENIAILKSKIESGEISTTIRQQVQARHIEGTAQFEQYKSRRIAEGKTPQSILTVTAQEAQRLVDKCACTGNVTVKVKKDGSVEIKEYTNADVAVGKYYAENAYHETKRMIIFYSKKGTHIVPTNPKEKRKW